MHSIDSVILTHRSLGRGRARGAFNLVELLVVIGIISTLMGFLLPALASARNRAQWLQCQSNLRQIGQLLLIYSNDWDGYIYPPNLGSNVPPEQRWPMQVFRPPAAYPSILICPADPAPYEQHSYIFNDHLYQRGIRYFSTNLGGLTPSDVVLMGELKDTTSDYYMQGGDYPSRIELYRHGIRHGSNYLFLDLHVGLFVPHEMFAGAADPWDINVTKPAEE